MSEAVRNCLGTFPCTDVAAQQNKKQAKCNYMLYKYSGHKHQPLPATRIQEPLEHGHIFDEYFIITVIIVFVFLACS
jgi:hypothetical protein